MRYTEVKLHRVAEEMLLDIEKETVKFRDNFDATFQEPEYLPAKLPNLLLMGSEGIAVGMATKIPPHNLNELADAIGLLIDKAELDKEGYKEFKKTNKVTVNSDSKQRKEETKEGIFVLMPDPLAREQLPFLRFSTIFCGKWSIFPDTLPDHHPRKFRHSHIKSYPDTHIDWHTTRYHIYSHAHGVRDTDDKSRHIVNPDTLIHQHTSSFAYALSNTDIHSHQHSHPIGYSYRDPDEHTHTD
jgi:hypothetical protein